MSHTEDAATHAVIVETELQFSLAELGRVCGVEVTLLELLVHEGVLTPQGEDPAQWRFSGAALPRARMATRLLRDLELSASGTALVMELLEEIGTLRAQLRRTRG
jgi:chaperone modulatory protein CbpM